MHRKRVAFMSHTSSRIIKIWFQTELGLENSASYYRQGRQLLLTFLTMVTRRSRCKSKFYALIGQNLTDEFMRKIYAACDNLFTDSWSSYSLVSSWDVFSCLFSTGSAKWITAAIEILLACQSHRESDFGWHRFVFHLAWCVRGFKRFWPEKTVGRKRSIWR